VGINRRFLQDKKFGFASLRIRLFCGKLLFHCVVNIAQIASECAAVPSTRFRACVRGHNLMSPASALSASSILSVASHQVLAFAAFFSSFSV
jgi:hypothetical protein